MTDIASSLEQEFADVSQAERESTIAELKKIEAAGRGSVDITPHAIALPVLLIVCGVIVTYAATTKSGDAGWIYLLGMALLVPGILILFIPRKPFFTLAEEGIRVRDTLLPWEHIEDYGISENGYNGFTMNTTLSLIHDTGYTPPKLGLFRMFGQTIHQRKEDRYETYLGLWVGAKGMNSEKLAQRIGDFLAAFHARAELARLRAD